jgi:hypothetical protein
MSQSITTPYHKMPGEFLTIDVQRRAADIAKDGAENIALPSVGYFMRIYAGAF